MQHGRWGRTSSIHGRPTNDRLPTLRETGTLRRVGQAIARPHVAAMRDGRHCSILDAVVRVQAAHPMAHLAAGKSRSSQQQRGYTLGPTI
jgi:hypothetical protein